MGCIYLILALLVPRLLMVFILLLTDWFSVAYDTFLWPLLGFVFMPYTTLAYMGAMLNANEVSGIWLVLVVVAAIVDVGHLGGSGRAAHGRRGRR
jgi:hypothetical protein